MRTENTASTPSASPLLALPIITDERTGRSLERDLAARVGPVGDALQDCVRRLWSQLARRSSGNGFILRTLSNEGFYLCPEGAARVTMRGLYTARSVTLSGQAAGIALTLIVLGTLSATPDGVALIRAVRALRSYAWNHPEVDAISIVIGAPSREQS
jgi:hypothetical protein